MKPQDRAIAAGVGLASSAALAATFKKGWQKLRNPPYLVKSSATPMELIESSMVLMPDKDFFNQKMWVYYASTDLPPFARNEKRPQQQFGRIKNKWHTALPVTNKNAKTWYGKYGYRPATADEAALLDEFFAPVWKRRLKKLGILATGVGAAVAAYGATDRNLQNQMADPAARKATAALAGAASGYAASQLAKQAAYGRAFTDVCSF